MIYPGHVLSVDLDHKIVKAIEMKPFYHADRELYTEQQERRSSCRNSWADRELPKILSQYQKRKPVGPKEFRPATVTVLPSLE
jgi:hypothetical protein